MYRQYSHSIPQFLVDRPRHLVNHCMERLDAAQSIPASDITVVDSLLGEFKVKSQMEQNVVYSIKFDDQSSMPNCECPDWLQTYLPCKHFLAIFHHVPGWDWTSLPTKYRESPMLLLDDHVMKKLHAKHDAADDQTTCITNLEMPVCPPDITQNGHSILPLPTKQKTSRTQATKCREVLNHLRNLTFLVHEEEPLTALQGTLSSALLELQQFVTTEDGIALENKESHQEDQQQSFPPSSTTQAKANPLPQRKQKRNKYSGRVGEKAGTMKKTYNVSFVPELAEPSKAHIPYSHAGLPVSPPKATQTPEQDSHNQPAAKKMRTDDCGDKAAPLTVEENIQEPKMNSTAFIVIDDNSPDPQQWIQFSDSNVYNTHFTLYQANKCNIANPNGWLMDSEIHAAQQLLKAQFPHLDGLNDPDILSGDLVTPAVTEFVQIINTGGHWVCLSTVGCTDGHVKVYDSMGTCPSRTAIINSCQMLFYNGKRVTVSNQKVQRQQGASDCGLFAIAFATSLCFGNDPQEISYAQLLLRSHFIACLEDHKMIPFATTDRRVQKHLSVSKAVVPIYCTCRMPNDGDAYVQCHHCNDWWHLKCVNIPPWAVESNKSWKCETCNKRKL